MLNFLASMTTPRKEAASQPTTAVQIQLSPDMSDEEILRQVRSMGITTAEDEPPSTPNDGGGGRSDTRAFYGSPDHVLNAIAEESERTYTDNLLQISRSSATLNETITHGKNLEMAKKKFQELKDFEDDTLIDNIFLCNDYAAQVNDHLQVSLVDILFPSGSPSVRAVDWTIARAKTACFVTNVDTGHKSTEVVSLAVIRVGVIKSPEVVRKRNLQLVEVLFFLLWKARCPSVDDKSLVEPYWRRRISEVLGKVKKIPEPAPGAEISKKVIVVVAKLDALLNMTDILDHEVRRKHFMLTAVGRMPDEFNNTFISQHRSTWIQDGYTWGEFMDLIMDFADNYDRMSISKPMSPRVHVARTTETVTNAAGSNDSTDQMDMIANLVEQVANLTNEITAIKKSYHGKKDKGKKKTSGESTNEVREGESCDVSPSLTSLDNTNITICASIARKMDDGSTEGCFDTGTSAICLPRQEMLDNPSEMKKSCLKIRVANGNVERVEGEGPFGGEPALVTSSFGSMLIPAGAVTKHSVVVFVDDRMLVMPKYRCSYQISRLDDLITRNAEQKHFYDIKRENGIYPITTNVARSMVKGPKRRTGRLKVANSAAYFTVKNDTKQELVRYWHEALGHASQKDMLDIVSMKMHCRPRGIPPALTVTAIKKMV